MNSLNFIVVIAMTCVGYISASNSFTNFVNMEKLYTLEDELITLSDVIIKQEKVLHGDEDIHGIHNISRTIESVKTIHREIVNNRNLSAYIVNPINMYHLTKRLAKDWTKVIATLEDSKSCAKVMRVKVQNMADNIPSGKYLKHVIEGVLRLQAIYNISVNDIISGTFTDIPTISKMSLDDAFDFARAAYEAEYYFLCVDWLQFVSSSYDPEQASFRLSNALNLMSSAYLKMKRPKDALAILDELLKVDPKNNVARRNSKYLVQQIDRGMTDRNIEQQDLKSKKDKRLQKLCRNIVPRNYTTSRQFCTYTGTRGMDFFDRPNIKTEVLSTKPLIVLYRNFTTPSQQKAVAHLGYEQMKNIMYKNHYTYPGGIEGLMVEDNTNWQWVPNLQRSLDNIDLTERVPGRSRLLVRNTGLHGLENYRLDKSERTRLGTFVIFLTEPAYGGGNMVFPFVNVTVTPEKGTVLFYERTVHKQATICPLIADTMWVGIYPLLDKTYSDICFKDNLRRPAAN